MAQYESSTGRAGGAKITDITKGNQNAISLYQRSSKWVSFIRFGVLKVMGRRSEESPGELQILATSRSDSQHRFSICGP